MASNSEGFRGEVQGLLDEVNAGVPEEAEVTWDDIVEKFDPSGVRGESLDNWRGIVREVYEFVVPSFLRPSVGAAGRKLLELEKAHLGRLRDVLPFVGDDDPEETPLTDAEKKALADADRLKKKEEADAEESRRLKLLEALPDAEAGTLALTTDRGRLEGMEDIRRVNGEYWKGDIKLDITWDDKTETYHVEMPEGHPDAGLGFDITPVGKGGDSLDSIEYSHADWEPGPQPTKTELVRDMIYEEAILQGASPTQANRIARNVTSNAGIGKDYTPDFFDKLNTDPSLIQGFVRDAYKADRGKQQKAISDQFTGHWDSMVADLKLQVDDPRIDPDTADTIQAWLDIMNDAGDKEKYLEGFLNQTRGYLFEKQRKGFLTTVDPMDLEGGATPLAGFAAGEVTSLELGDRMIEYFELVKKDALSKTPTTIARYLTEGFKQTEVQIGRQAARRDQFDRQIENYQKRVDGIIRSSFYDEEFKKALSEAWDAYGIEMKSLEREEYARLDEVQAAKLGVNPNVSALAYINATSSINSDMLEALKGTTLWSGLSSWVVGPDGTAPPATIGDILTALPHINNKKSFIATMEADWAAANLSTEPPDFGGIYDDAMTLDGSAAGAYKLAEAKAGAQMTAAKSAETVSEAKLGIQNLLKEAPDAVRKEWQMEGEWDTAAIEGFIANQIKEGNVGSRGITDEFKSKHITPAKTTENAAAQIAEEVAKPGVSDAVRKSWTPDAIADFIKGQITMGVTGTRSIVAAFSDQLKAEAEAPELAAHVKKALDDKGAPPEATGYYTPAVLAKFLEDAAEQGTTAKSLFNDDLESRLSEFRAVGSLDVFKSPQPPDAGTDMFVSGDAATGAPTGTPATAGGTLGEWLRKRRPGNTALVDTYLGQLNALWAEAKAAGQAGNEERYIKDKFNAQAAEDIGTVKKELELNAQGYKTRDAQGNRLEQFSLYLTNPAEGLTVLPRFVTAAGVPVEDMPGSQAERERRAAEAQAPGPLGLSGFAQSIGVGVVADPRMTPEEKKAYDDIQSYMADLTSGERPFDENAKIFLLSRSPIVREMQNLGVRAGLSGEEIDALVTKVNTAAFDKFGEGAGAVLQQEIDTLTARNREIYEQALDLEDEFIGTMDSEMLTEGQALPPQKQWIETDKQGTSKLVSTAQAGLAQGDTPHERARSEILRRQKEGLSPFAYSPEEIEARTKSKAAAQDRTAKLSEIQAAQANELERQKRIAERQRLRGQGSAPPPGAGTGPTGERRA